MGRLSDYSEAIADAILERLAEGESLRAICEDEGQPNRTTVFRWLSEREDFAARYAYAREAQVESHYDDMDKIEQDVLDGVLPPKAANVVLGNKRWRLEKLKSRVYGAKVEHTGGLTHTHRQARDLTDEELAAIVAAEAAGG
jgi:hypothetical protein